MSTLRCSLTVWSTGFRPSSSPHRAELMPESFRSTHSCVFFASFHGVMVLTKWTLFWIQALTTRRQGATMNFSSRTEFGNLTVFQFNGTFCNMILLQVKGKPYCINWNCIVRFFSLFHRRLYLVPAAYEMYLFIRALQTLTHETTKCCNYYLEGIGNIVIIMIIRLRSRRLQIVSNLGLTRQLHPSLNHYEYTLAVSVVNWPYDYLASIRGLMGAWDSGFFLNYIFFSSYFF